MSFFDYYIHGHKVGGTNPTLIEAINLKKKFLHTIVPLIRRFWVKKIYFKNDLELADLIRYYENSIMMKISIKKVLPKILLIIGI